MKRYKKLENKKGFTLVELLVVIAIMSILTVITVGQFQNARRKARDVQRKGDISALAKALQMYYTDYGTFPLDINGSKTSDSWGDELTDAATPPYVYMKNLPKENYLSIPFCYAVSADQKMFGVFTALENDQDNDYNKQSADVMDNYTCGGNSDYNFVITSPNASLEDIPTN